MDKKTYLQESVKGGRLMRWNKNMMPLKVYIAPMKFYSKQGQDAKYRGFVKKALDEWQKVSNGKVSFVIVDSLLTSNVNIDWKRVERKALGCCYFQYDRANRLYSAEVSIGLTDGLVHADYMDEGEVYHTILHEIGHAVGLGHSPFKKDIMYTPHQKGVLHVGEGDRLSINWLYTFPQGKTVAEIASKYGVAGNDLDEVVTKIISKQTKTEFEKVKESVSPIPSRDLLEESETIANIRKYHMSLQNVKISNDLKEQIRRHHRDSGL
ncbi:MAG: matrixin family metalloprotease [Cyanobacteria bacterium SIG26]|nr:matrixin family metalloprotease [Cyanobacteria bacterium SIG26]